MNRIFAALACIAVLGISAGCHGQVPVTPPVVTLPVAGNGNYTPLNAVGSSTPPTTALTYTDSPSGEVGYVGQGYLPAQGTVGTQGYVPPQYGPWSNVVGPVTGGATGKVNLSWTCTAAAGKTCSGVLWVVSRASAVTALAPAQPVANSPTSAAVDKPAQTNMPTLALNVKLTATKQ